MQTQTTTPKMNHITHETCHNISQHATKLGWAMEVELLNLGRFDTRGCGLLFGSHETGWQYRISNVALSACCPPSKLYRQYISLTKILQVFHFWHAKTCTKIKNKKCTSIDTHNLEVDMYCDLWRKKIHVKWHARNWNDTCRQLKYYKLQFKYSENITYNL
jgi:hypothetical protein